MTSLACRRALWHFSMTCIYKLFTADLSCKYCTWQVWFINVHSLQNFSMWVSGHPSGVTCAYVETDSYSDSHIGIVTNIQRTHARTHTHTPHPWIHVTDYGNVCTHTHRTQKCTTQTHSLTYSITNNSMAKEVAGLSLCLACRHVALRCSGYRCRCLIHFLKSLYSLKADRKRLNEWVLGLISLALIFSVLT